jgi:hypothetical protein
MYLELCPNLLDKQLLNINRLPSFYYHQLPGLIEVYKAERER